MSAMPTYSRFSQPSRRSSGFYDSRFDGNAARSLEQPDVGFHEEGAYAPGTYAPDISVIPGNASPSVSISPAFIFLVKTAAVLFVVIALLGCIRITLTSAAVEAAVEKQELTSSIKDIRVESKVLEVSQSSLTNPTRIKESATLLGMAAPEQVTNVNLADDVVKLDEDGSLSLSRSAAALTQE